MKRRDFLKTVASSGIVLAASDLVGDLIAQSPQGKPLESQFKGLADVALKQGDAAGARPLLFETVALARELGDRVMLLHVFESLADLAEHWPALLDAVERAAEQVDLFLKTVVESVRKGYAGRYSMLPSSEPKV